MTSVYFPFCFSDFDHCDWGADWGNGKIRGIELFQILQPIQYETTRSSPPPSHISIAGVC